VAAQDLAHLPKHTIAAVMAAQIVDLLEVIEVDDDDARGHAVGQEILDEALDAVSVQDIGQAIERREPLELVFLMLEIVDPSTLLAMLATQPHPL
jgi:hypothetical protein